MNNQRPCSETSGKHDDDDDNQWEKYEFRLPHDAGALFERSNSGTYLLRVRNDLTDKLRELHREGRDAMIVWEFLSDLLPWKVRVLAKELRQWDVHIIAQYRRWYEWVPSLLAQMQRPTFLSRAEYLHWPRADADFETKAAVSQTTTLGAAPSRLGRRADRPGRERSSV
jgi:hypothetical protein